MNDDFPEDKRVPTPIAPASVLVPVPVFAPEPYDYANAPADLVTDADLELLRALLPAALRH